MSQVNVGLCGLGTVGTGVVKILQNHADEIKYKVGSELNIKKILVHDLNKARDVAISREWLTTDPDELVNNADIDIIIEVMGGIEDTNLLLEKAIRNKKHIVTANKDLMAVHGQKLLKLAKENQCDILYDASVAGGIPIIRSLTEGLASDKIQKNYGYCEWYYQLHLNKNDG